MKDCYEILGTNREAVDCKGGMKTEFRTEEEKDDFLKDKYETAKRKIQYQKDVAQMRGEKEKIGSLNEELKVIILAYRQIESSSLREKYNQEMDSQRKGSSVKKGNFQRGNPYQRLNTDEETVQKLPSEEEKDKFLKNRKKYLLDRYLYQLEEAPFKEKTKLQTLIQQIEEAYDTVSTQEKRKQYRIAMETKRITKLNEEQIREKYSHISEYNPNSLGGTFADENYLKMKVVRREVLSNEISYPDEQNRNLRVRKTGRIEFINWMGGQLYVDELEVRREIEGKEKVDTIYTNLSVPDLDIDVNTGVPANPGYYNCFTNKLLAEDTIEGSKYNQGFIGGIEKDTHGNYYITLEKEQKEQKEEKLPPMEQQQLAAVIRWKEIEKEKSSEGAENVI